MFGFRELPPDYIQTRSFIGIQRHGVDMVYRLADAIKAERLYDSIVVDPVPPNERGIFLLPVQINSYRPHTWKEKILCPCRGRGHEIVRGAISFDLDAILSDPAGVGAGQAGPGRMKHHICLQYLDFGNARLRELVEEFNAQELGIWVSPERESPIRPPDPAWAENLDERLKRYLEGLDKEGNKI